VIGEPIYTKFLNNNYLLAIEFREGFVFGRVIRRRICQYKPYKLIDANGNSVDISPSSHAGEYRFRDPRNVQNDILYLDSATNSGYAWILHGAVGIRPEYVRLYLRIPEGKDIPGKFPAIDPVRPKSGDDVGYITSNESPYDMPTDFAEIVIPPMVHIGAEYYNTDTARSHRPVLNLLFCVYWMQILQPDVHGKLISSIAARKLPAAFLTAGVGDEPMSVPTQVMREWAAKPMKLDEAITLG